MIKNSERYFEKPPLPLAILIPDFIFFLQQQKHKPTIQIWFIGICYDHQMAVFFIKNKFSEIYIPTVTTNFLHDLLLKWKMYNPGQNILEIYNF